MNQCFGIAIIILVVLYLCHSPGEHDLRCTRIDGRCYQVTSNAGFQNLDEAADMLAKINKFLLEFMRHLRKKYLWGKEGTAEQRATVYRIFMNYSPDMLGENNPKDTTNTSYLLGKNREMRFCLREKKSGKNMLHNIEDIKFVALHELSHAGDKETGHGPSFWAVFKFLLIEAKQTNTYVPKDYSQTSMNYCGLDVHHNPYFDTSVEMI